MVCIRHASFYRFNFKIKGTYTYIITSLCVSLSGFPESTIHTCPKIWQYDVCICEMFIKKNTKKHRSILLLFCRFAMWYHMESSWEWTKPLLNATCSRGAITCFLITGRIENYIYICICKRSLRRLSFLNRKYYTKAPQANGRYSFFFIWFYFIYSICNYVMYRGGIEIK